MIRHVGERLDRKAKVNFRNYDVAAGTLVITIHILPNISKC